MPLGDPSQVPSSDRYVISVVTPAHNEEASIERFFRALDDVMTRLPAYDWEIVCVDDGSSDRTLDRLTEVALRDSRVVVVELSRNFGKEAAMTAGLAEARGDAVVIIDFDLQDPPELIADMIAAWRNGADVVLAKRRLRDNDSFSKRFTAEMFYRVFNQLSGIKLPENVGDFRLMSRQVVDAVLSLGETERFMKGILTWVGFRTLTLEYSRPARAAGTSKFTFFKLWNLALQGITGFSALPLRVWTYIGFAGALFSASYLMFIVIKVLAFGNPVPGYPSLLVSILFLGSLQLFSIGILGEYLGRTYMETKRRPNFIIRKVYRQSSGSEAGPRQ